MTALIVAIITTAIVDVTIVLIDRIVIAEVRRANAIYTRRRTTIYKDIH